MSNLGAYEYVMPVLTAGKVQHSDSRDFSPLNDEWIVRQKINMETPGLNHSVQLHNAKCLHGCWQECQWRGHRKAAGKFIAK